MTSSEDYIVSYQTQVEIQPGSDYYVRFNTHNFTFEDSSMPAFLDNWSEEIERAIAKSPQWLQVDLFKQFQNIEYPEEYTDLLLHANKTMTDELAFCIAHSPQGNIPSAESLLENVQWLYRIDSFIDYAEIIDVQDKNDDYYSTIRYTVLDNGMQKIYTLPTDIYYWGIVHPGISGEDVDIIYQTFWREFLFSHNDRGYPLLKELIKDVTFLWDNESYNQPNQRIWTEWITQHPTAVEAVSYWVGKTVPFYAIGDRPLQPNSIAHQHNGYCGELQTLAVAANRAVLIPSIGANNIGEDHVWREFYHDGWHQSDNWWADTGGCIDIPWVYTDGWGKDMSAIFTEYGDGKIEDVTSRYLHPDETITVNFSVYDAFLHPYDNARITVLVKGLKDITWHQYQILLFLENLWRPYENRLNGTIIEKMYRNIRKYIDNLPDVIDSALIATWNYTDIHGNCSFTLGKNDEYIFLIQSPSTSLPWPLAKYTAIRRLSSHQSMEYRIHLIDFSSKPLTYTSKESKGPYSATVTYQATWKSAQQHIKNRNIGIKETMDDLDVLFMDEQNFQQYQQKKSFETYTPESSFFSKTSVDFDEDLYVVIPNPSKHTTVLVDLDLEITGIFDGIHVSIDQPRSTLFSQPIFSVGDIIEVSGSANQPSQLAIDQNIIQIPEGDWMIEWNTTGMIEGIYEITIQSGHLSEKRIIELIDDIPPMITIKKPQMNRHYQISDNLVCKGMVKDDSLISSVTFTIDDIEQITIHPDTIEWNVSFNLHSYTVGSHRVRILASDVNGNLQEASFIFFITDSSSIQPPQIVNDSSILKKIGDWTQVIISAEGIASPIYPLKEMNVVYQRNETIRKKPMFLYASHPVLDRHTEDPYFNQTNTPIYGCLLGDFYKGETITYWIEAMDVSDQSNTTAPITLDF